MRDYVGFVIYLSVVNLPIVDAHAHSNAYVHLQANKLLMLMLSQCIMMDHNKASKPPYNILLAG